VQVLAHGNSISGSRGGEGLDAGKQVFHGKGSKSWLQSQPGRKI
jgi:hypothetical protein